MFKAIECIRAYYKLENLSKHVQMNEITFLDFSYPFLQKKMLQKHSISSPKHYFELWCQIYV
jgi:hypothetical protein